MTYAIIHISSTRSTRFNAKVWSSDQNSFNRPITCSIWILALAVRFLTTNSDDVGSPLLLTKGGILAATLCGKKGPVH